MDCSKAVLYKICGKVELEVEKSDLLDTFYIVQWDSQSGPITVQTRNTLSKYINEVAKFEGKSTTNHFYDRSRATFSRDQISGEQASFIINTMLQYQDCKNFYPQRTPSSDSISKPSSAPGALDTQSARTISLISSSPRDSDLESSTPPRYSSPYMDALYQEDETIDDGEEVPSLMDTRSVFVDNFDNEPYHKVGMENKMNGSRLGSHDSVSVHESDDYPIFTDSDETVPSAKSFSEKYTPSPHSYESDFSNLNMSFNPIEYETWKSKWINLIKEDMEKSNGALDWETLEIISEMDWESKHYYIGYDTETKFMTMIEDDNIPESEQYKIKDLTKFRGLK